MGVITVLVSCWVFLPIIFERDTAYTVDTRQIIPPAPNVPTLHIDLPSPPMNATASSTQDMMFRFNRSRDEVSSKVEPEQASAAERVVESVEAQVEDLHTQTAANKTQKKSGVVDEKLAEFSGLNDEGIPKAWIVQAGEFSSYLEAQGLTEKLLEGGHRAYAREAKSQNGEVIHRIYVGPKLSQQAMQDEKRLIEDTYTLKTILLVFEP